MRITSSEELKQVNLVSLHSLSFDPMLKVNTGLEIATNTVAFITKTYGGVANLRLVFTFTIMKQKDYQLVLSPGLLVAGELYFNCSFYADCDIFKQKQHQTLN